MPLQKWPPTTSPRIDKLWQRRWSSPRLALFAVGCTGSFLPSTAATAALRRFSATMSAAQRQVVLGVTRSSEISCTSFASNLSMMTKWACLKLFRFNRASLEALKSLLARPTHKQRPDYNGYATSLTLAVRMSLRRLATSSHCCDMKRLFGMSSTIQNVS